MTQLLKYSLLIAWIAFSIYMCYGCTQREYQHDFTDFKGDPETYYYKGNYCLTKASAESVVVTTLDGTIIKINRPVQDNDSLKVISPVVGIIESEAK